MRLLILITEGPEKGRKLNLAGESSVGRRGATILLDDPKLSGIHAIFQYSDEVGWVIKDNNSRNGVFINGIKEPRHIIQDGDEIMIGSSHMHCKLMHEVQYNFSEKFKAWIQNLFKKASNHKSKKTEIKPEMRLKMVQGIQYGQKWDIFYGPREAGADSDDICLFEEKAPSKAFEIRVKGKYAYFYTDHQDQVKINQKNVKEKQFTPGDVISIGDSEILVQIDEGHGFDS